MLKRRQDRPHGAKHARPQPVGEPATDRRKKNDHQREKDDRQSNLGRRESQNALQVERQEKESRSMRKRHKEMTQNSGREKAHLEERQIEQRRRIFALEVQQ